MTRKSIPISSPRQCPNHAWFCERCNLLVDIYYKLKERDPEYPRNCPDPEKFPIYCPLKDYAEDEQV